MTDGGKDFKDIYERYCSAMDKEDSLINNRLNWLMASQSILFAAVAWSDTEAWGIMKKIVPLMGGATAFLIGVSIWGAVCSFMRYRRILLKESKNCKAVEKEYPQVDRKKCNIKLGFVAPIVLPVIFTITWLIFWCRAQ